MKAALRSLLPVLGFVLLGIARPAIAQSDAILPIDQYTSEKAKHLATTHAAALTDLNAKVYHCLPWLEIYPRSIGFFKPKYLTADDRYLSLRVFVEQEPSAAFAKLTPEERAAAMFSRYVGHMLRRMTRDRSLVTDPDLAGFTVIVEWVKQGGAINGRPVHETIAVFVEKSLALQYLGGRVHAAEVARRAHVLAFDGETALGEITLAAWDDDFATTFQVKDYKVPDGLDCSASARN
jgi:hypothetical protein